MCAKFKDSDHPAQVQSIPHQRESLELSLEANYHIRPNYRTVHLGFSKALGKLVVKHPPNMGTLQRKINSGLHEERILCDIIFRFLYRSICYGYSFK